MSGTVRTAWITGVCAWLLAGVSQADLEREFPMEPLRDPFWPVGYFPETWQKDQPEDQQASSRADSDWSGPEAMIRVTAVSRMGEQAIAIINGDMKEVGDVIEMTHSGRVYKWKLTKVNANGTIGLERMEVNNRTLGFQPGEKK